MKKRIFSLALAACLLAALTIPAGAVAVAEEPSVPTISVEGVGGTAAEQAVFLHRLHLLWPGGVSSSMEANLSNAEALAQAALGTISRSDGSLEVFVWDLEAGKRLDSQTVEAADWNGDGVPEPAALHALEDGGGRYYVGTAGAFRVNGDGLVRLFDRPTVDVAVNRMMYPTFLAYTPGVTPVVDGRQTGDEVWDGAVEGGSPVCRNVKASGIAFTELVDASTAYGYGGDGRLYWYAVTGSTVLPIRVEGSDPMDLAWWQENLRLQSLGY